ncbi:MAG: hypothetical protein OEZ47_17270, partial [Gammaproteobacteria bacterium]|nr:hypothetical protein [Gammaproteobacteria bacterium]
MKAGRLVVKQHAPWFYPVVIFSGILVALLAGWILYVLGQQNAGFDSVEAAQQTDILRNTIGELERENGALRDKVALLDRSKQVDQQAYTQVDDTIRNCR